jgi:hypothetical protein
MKKVLYQFVPIVLVNIFLFQDNLLFVLGKVQLHNIQKTLVYFQSRYGVFVSFAHDKIQKEEPAKDKA